MPWVCFFVVVYLLIVAYGVGFFSLVFFLDFCFYLFIFFLFCPSWSLPDVIRACEPLSNC